MQRRVGPNSLSCRPSQAKGMRLCRSRLLQVAQTNDAHTIKMKRGRNGGTGAMDAMPGARRCVPRTLANLNKTKNLDTFGASMLCKTFGMAMKIITCLTCYVRVSTDNFYCIIHAYSMHAQGTVDRCPGPAGPRMEPLRIALTIAEGYQLSTRTDMTSKDDRSAS